MSFLDLLERLYAQRRRYLEDLPCYLRLIKEVVLRHDPSAKVFLFGSYAEGTARPDSDVDVLIVTELAAEEEARLRLRKEIDDALGRPNPFELHIATPTQYKEWYVKFIKRYVEV
ncbi:MAG: nucleotidyltransferase domain-containing protein [Pyrobaculum sp.]|jgi:predicted nucleotidyltransferase